MSEDRDIAAIESVYDALDDGAPERALEIVRAALDDGDGENPILHYLCGRALLDLERPGAAADAIGRALEIDPDDPEFRAYLGWALFRACRFEEGRRVIEQAPGKAAPLPESHYVRALFLERAGRTRQAEEHFRKAAALDPEAFPMPSRFDDREFGRQIELARAGLHERFRGHLDDVTLLVEDLPSDAVLFEEDPPLDPEQLLGLFVGVPLGQASSLGPGGEMPPRIHLFKKNLERYSAGAGDLAEQIRLTLYHELGHYLGMEEDELEELGYG